MRYIGVFAAVIFTLAAMDVLMAMAIRQAAATMREQARARFLSQLSVMDELYMEKRERLDVLRQEAERSGRNVFEGRHAKAAESDAGSDFGRHPARASAIGMDLLTPTVSKVNFKEEYRLVRENFMVDRTAEILDIAGHEPDKQSWKGEAAMSFLAELDMDTAVDLSTLTSDEQLDILSALADGNQKKLLDGYMEETGNEDGFDAIAFRQYLATMSGLYDDWVTVYGTENLTEGEVVDTDSRIRFKYAPDLVEGVRVVRGSRMYDYGV